MARKAPISGKKRTNLKPQKSRELIRKFHVLLKRQQQSPNDKQIQREIDALGGLQVYQQASISGQGTKRGGDSSIVLMKWLKERSLRPSSLLEVGCLQVQNECTKSGVFDRIDRIDLNSQSPQIKKQDFMDRKPSKYECVSLSLVLNFVPEAAARGRMLLHTTKFLDVGGLLFFVLPAPCVDNSRYMTPEHLGMIWEKLGYEVLETKTTSKIIYLLLQKVNEADKTAKVPKKLLRDGKGMNNFSVILGGD